MDWFLYDRDPCHESVKDRVYDSVFIRKNTGTRKPLIWYDLRIGYQYLQYRSKIFFGDAFKYNIQFCPPERLNKSLVFSSIISFQDVVQKLRLINFARNVAKSTIGSLLTEILNDKFCDAETINQDEILNSFGTLLNVKESLLISFV